LFVVSVSTAVATWTFTFGGYIASCLPALSGTIKLIAGSLVDILMIYSGANACPGTVRRGFHRRAQTAVGQQRLSHWTVLAVHHGFAVHHCDQLELPAADHALG
jgi:hypothetical protein